MKALSKSTRLVCHIKTFKHLFVTVIFIREGQDLHCNDFIEISSMMHKKKGEKS